MISVFGCVVVGGFFWWGLLGFYLWDCDFILYLMDIVVLLIDMVIVYGKFCLVYWFIFKLLFWWDYWVVFLWSLWVLVNCDLDYGWFFWIDVIFWLF